MDAQEHLRRNAELEAQLAARDQRIAEQDALIAEQTTRIAQLEKKVAELLERLGRNSGNSNLPPSGDAPSMRGEKKRKTSPSKRRRDGQVGHRGSRRALIPGKRVDEFVDLYPSHCTECSASLPEVQDPLAQRYQVIELPAFEPHTTEYRRHTVRCPCCRSSTTAAYDPERIPSSPFGPRLMSAIALLTGVYHLSRCKTVQLLSDLVGVRISLGAVSAVEARVSEAVVPAVDEAFKRAQNAPVKHTDGTTWFMAGKMLSLWTIATTCVTVFKIVANGRADTLKPLYGALRGILVSDRAAALKFWAMERRQICWAHQVAP